MNNPIQCLIVDDEPLAIQVLSNYVSKSPKLQLKASCNSSLEALEILKRERIDLLFLDIQMPDLTGLEILDLLPQKPLVIFTTAFPNYAIEGFNHNAVDYLLKPIPFVRFLQAIEKAQDRIGSSAQPKPASDHAAPTPPPSHIFIKTEYKIVRVDLSSIIRIEGLKDYVKIYTEEAMLLSLMSIKSLEAQLPKHLFARIHKSHIIGLNHIDRIERNCVFIQDQSISIGATYKQAFFEQIGI